MALGKEGGICLLPYSGFRNQNFYLRHQMVPVLRTHQLSCLLLLSPVVPLVSLRYIYPEWHMLANSCLYQRGHAPVVLAVSKPHQLFSPPDGLLLWLSTRYVYPGWHQFSLLVSGKFPTSLAVQ